MRYVLVILIIILTTPSFARDYQSLSNTEWVPDKGEYGYRISFHPDNTFDTRVNFEGSELFRGTYRFNRTSGTVILRTTGIISSVQSFKDQYMNKEYTFSIKESTDALCYQDMLLCKDGKCPYGNVFFESKSFLKTGIRRVVDGNDVYVINKKGRMHAANVFLRTKPDASSEKYSLSLFVSDKSSETFFLPIDHEVFVICRTSKKVNINGIENYWFYVDLCLSSYDILKLNNNEIHSRKAWIFGEYIKI